MLALNGRSGTDNRPISSLVPCNQHSVFDLVNIYIYEGVVYRGCLSNNPKHLGNFRTRSAIYETMLRSLYPRWNKPLGTFSVMLATLKDYNSNGSVIRGEAYITLFRCNQNERLTRTRENLILANDADTKSLKSINNIRII